MMIPLQDVPQYLVGKLIYKIKPYCTCIIRKHGTYTVNNVPDAAEKQYIFCSRPVRAFIIPNMGIKII